MKFTAIERLTLVFFLGEGPLDTIMSQGGGYYLPKQAYLRSARHILFDINCKTWE